MQTRSRFLDDVSQLMTNAAGVAQGARAEAENAFRSAMERFLNDSNLVTREEFDAVREMAVKAREGKRGAFSPDRRTGSEAGRIRIGAFSRRDAFSRERTPS